MPTLQLLTLWETKTRLTDDKIDNALDKLSNLPSYKKRNFIFIPSTILHERRGHDSYLPHVKSNLVRLGLINGKQEAEDKCDIDDCLAFFALYRNEHFSLAILDKKHGVLNHYDSLEGYNDEEFEHLHGTLIDLGIFALGEVTTHQVKFFQQDNDWECGYYCILAMWAAYMNGVAVDTKGICTRKDAKKRVGKSMRYMLENLKLEGEGEGEGKPKSKVKDKGKGKDMPSTHSTSASDQGNKGSEDEYDIPDVNNNSNNDDLDLQSQTPQNLIPEESEGEGEGYQPHAPCTNEEGVSEDLGKEKEKEEPPATLHKESSKKHTKKSKKHSDHEDNYNHNHDNNQDHDPSPLESDNKEELEVEVKSRSSKKKESRIVHTDKSVVKKSKREKEKDKEKEK